MEWEHVAYFLAGIVIAGVLAAISQIVNMRLLTNGKTKLHVCMKKEGENGNR